VKQGEIFFSPDLKVGNRQQATGNNEEPTFMHGGENFFMGTAWFLQSSATGGDCHPLRREETSQTLFPSAFCPLPSALFLESVAQLK